MLNPVPVEVSREDLFVERYRKLRGWSLQMTQHDPELAEDLLHDLFIQFTLDAPELHEIRNLDAYLYAMLRNLHLARRRRDSRNTLQQLSIVEYDSAEVGLRTVDFRDQIQAQDDLRRLARHAGVRKESSKTGSVLILRFFLGYYPEEIVKVMRASRAWVDTSLKLARREAKAALATEPHNSHRLEFINRTPVPEVPPTGYAQSLDAFMGEIRQMIFQDRKGDCFGIDSLRLLYFSDAPTPIECSQLAHIVSCSQCLDAANQLLGLPLLAERNATDTLGREPRKRGGGGRGGNGEAGGGSLSKVKLNQYRRRAKDTFVHKPAELCVAVNGYALGSQRVTSERSELNLVVDEEVRVGFVEVFTEQKFRLLLMPINELPPDGPSERAVRVRLSDERLLSLTLQLASPSPTIQVVYSDPYFNEARELPSAVEAGLEVRQRDSLTRATSDEPALNEATKVLEAEPEAMKLARPSIVELFLRAIADKWFWLRPQTVTAVFALLLLAGFAYLGLRSRIAKPTAAELLYQSMAAEEALLARTDLVLHRTFTLEERDPGGRILSNRRIESWHSAEKGTTARRLYDDRGGLIAGDWRRWDGVQTLYHHRSKPQLQLSPERRRGTSSSLSFDNVWQFEPSAKAFTSIVLDSGNTQVEERGSVYIISGKSVDGTSASSVITATLVLSKVDLHATELTLTLRDGNEVREYRMIESSTERRAPSTVAPSVFEPDPEFVVPAHDPGSKDSGVETSSPLALGTSPVMATAALEVEVVNLLNNAGAFMGEQISVQRTGDGKLQVNALIETDKRKAELLNTLAPVKGNPAIKINIETVAEAQAREAKAAKGKQTSGGVTVDTFTATENTSPVYNDLRKKFDEPGARAFADRVLRHSQQARRHALAAKQISDRFSQADLASLTPAERAKWLGLIAGHAGKFLAESESIRRELQTVFPDLAGGGASPRVASDKEIQEAVRELYRLSVACDEDLRGSFALLTGAGGSAEVKTAKFWRALNNAVATARSLHGAK